jgi:hypothetical protein
MLMGLTHTTVKAVFLSGHFLLINHILASRHIMGNNRRQSQQSRLELELGLNKCQILKKKSLRKVLTFFAVPM